MTDAQKDVETFDHPMNSQFRFKVDGVEIGRFAEVTGLQVDIEVATWQEGGENGYIHQFPGRIKWPNIVLKRGFVNNDALFEWAMASSGEKFAANGSKLTRRGGEITSLGSNDKVLRSWAFKECFAVRWNGPSFNVTGNDPLVEEIEIAHHGFIAKKGK
jgi:phage tail-like protein